MDIIFGRYDRAGGAEMNGKKAVREFMLYIAAGFAVYVPVVCLGFVIFGKFSLPVLFGALYGSGVMILYYFLFARAILKAAGTAESNPDGVKKRIQAAYSMRILLLVILMGGGVILATKFDLFHWLPLILSILVPRISIAVYQIIHKNKDNTDDKEGDGLGN